MRPIRTAFRAGLCALLALALSPSAHAAQGVNLTWSRCHGEGVGTQNRTFACDTNVGEEVLVASFVLDAPLAQVSGNEVVIDLISQDDPLPAWWDFRNAGTCRQTSLSANVLADATDVVCVDWAAGKSESGIGSYSMSMGTIDPNLNTRHRRLSLAIAVPPTEFKDLLANTEYFACNIVMDHAKTVGTDACAGCSGSVCLVLSSLNVTTPVLANNVFLQGGTTPGSDMAHWQGSGADCNLVPVRNRTWGQVKALYR